MKTLFTLGLFSALFCAVVLGQAMRGKQGVAALPAPRLDQKVQDFEVTDASLIDALSALSSNSIENLHLGIEQLLRNRLSDPEDRSVLFSLHLKNETVRNILDAVCRLDARYAWSTDGSSINIYPRAIVSDPSYLLNLQLQQITLTDIPDPDKMFSPLHKQLPREELGYIQTGGDISYTEPWTVTFEHLTVRQLINRVAEHLGPRSSWIFHGTKSERLFTFQKGAFHTHK